MLPQKQSVTPEQLSFKIVSWVRKRLGGKTGQCKKRPQLKAAFLKPFDPNK